jgi:hypothetical protein
LEAASGVLLRRRRQTHARLRRAATAASARPCAGRCVRALSFKALFLLSSRRSLHYGPACVRG